MHSWASLPSSCCGRLIIHCPIWIDLMRHTKLVCLHWRTGISFPARGCSLLSDICSQPSRKSFFFIRVILLNTSRSEPPRSAWTGLIFLALIHSSNYCWRLVTLNLSKMNKRSWDYIMWNWIILVNEIIFKSVRDCDKMQFEAYQWSLCNIIRWVKPA